MAFLDEINQNIGFFIYIWDFNLLFRGIIRQPKANNTFGSIPIDSGFVVVIKVYSWNNLWSINYILDTYFVYWVHWPKNKISELKSQFYKFDVQS